MFNPSHDQVRAYRQFERLNMQAARRPVQTARENGASLVVIERSSPPPRIIDLVTDALSGIAGAIAAAGRRPHWV
jgi:hypothetical protein